MLFSRAVPFLVALSCLLFVASANDTAKTENVVIATHKNFEELTNGPLLIEFYAPWCGHCKRLAPTYEQVATNLKGSVTVAKVDATVEQGLAGRFPISGFPTIYFVLDEKVYEYRGSRTAEAIQKFTTGGYKDTEPLDWMSSPFGAIGKLKGHILGLGDVAVNIHAKLVGMGMPVAVATSVMMITVVVVTFATMGMYVWATLEKEKDE